MLRFTFVAINSGITTFVTADQWGLRPLTPRSIVLSVLLGSHPPEMPVDRLLDFTALFGHADGSVRTALSRLVKSGDLEVTDATYRLSERLVERQREQDAGRAPVPAEWDGSWWVAVVVAERRPVAERREFRSRIIGARFGELRPDTWIRPANIDVPLDLPDVVLTRGPVLSGDTAALLEGMWDLDAFESTASTMLRELDRVGANLQPPVADDVLPDAFAALAAGQRFLRREPQLPHQLTEHTSADTLRARYGDVVADFQAALRSFFERGTPSREGRQ